jgi:glycosyltransferase involved in cell wall biosynthesis
LTTRVALDVAPLRKPGADRGLGRNIAAVTEFFSRNSDYVAVPVDVVSERAPRVREFLEVGRRFAAVRRSRAALYHSMTPFHVVPGLLSRTVVSILDIIPLEARAHQSTGIKTRLFFRAARGAAAVVTISEYTRSRIVTILEVDPDRVFVAPLPVAAAFRGSEHVASALPDVVRERRFVAGVVDLRAPDPRKRVEWLLGAMRRLSSNGLGTVFVGPGSELLPAPFVGLGRVSDAVLAGVLSHAEALVYTSAYEGQGMPPLEAMAVGTPVVAFANSSLPEVVGGGGVLLPEERSPAEAASSAHSENDAEVGAIVDAVLRITNDEEFARTLRAAAVEHAATFDDDLFDAGLSAAYRRALAP